VAGVWPALVDDTVLAEHLLDSQLLLVWMVTWELLPELELAGTAGPASGQAALVTWWRDLAQQAGRSGLADVAAHAESVAAAVDARCGPGLGLALYPAFR
jgi:hypothetical protein